MTNGYLYCVYSIDQQPNKFFTDEFLVSLQSLKKILPTCHVSLYTNIVFDNIYGIDHVIYDSQIDKNHICKAVGLLKSPYQKTILLDTDTLIHRSIINDIFKVLDDFNFTCCHGNFWASGQIYPDLNTGLIGVNKNKFTDEQITQWITKHRKNKCKSDQKYFRDIFLEHKKDFYILPAYFMYRWHHYKDYPEQAVISHEHCMSKEKITKKIINIYSKSINYKEETLD